MSTFQTTNTVNTVDIMDQNAVHRFLSEVPNRETHFSLVQNGTEVARVIPVKEKKGPVSDEVTKKRLEALEEMRILSKQIAENWGSDETAAEAVANDRREL